MGLSDDPPQLITQLAANWWPAQRPGAQLEHGPGVRADAVSQLAIERRGTEASPYPIDDAGGGGRATSRKSGGEGLHDY